MTIQTPSKIPIRSDNLCDMSQTSSTPILTLRTIKCIEESYETTKLQSKSLFNIKKISKLELN